MHFISYVIILHCFFVFGLCQQFDNNYGLVITEKNGNFRLAKPYKNAFENHPTLKIESCRILGHMAIMQTNVCTVTFFSSFYRASENEKTYIACPLSDIPINSLFQVLPVDLNSDFTDTNFCDVGIDVVKAELKKFCDRRDGCNSDIRLFHYGFKVHTAYLMKRRQITRERPEYKSWNPNYDLILGLAVYESKDLKKTLAVQYDLLSTPVDPWNKSEFIENYEKINGEISEESGSDDSSDLNALFGAMTIVDVSLIRVDDWIHTTDGNTDIQVSATLLAPNEHFHIPLWKQTVFHSANLIYIPIEVKNKWEDVAKFSRIVAKHLGDLKVRAGITGKMAKNVDGVEKPVLVTIGNKTIALPKYYWYAFEYLKDEKSYGILVVLNGNPVEDTEKICNDDVCTTNKWSISNDDFKSGKIYCCPMTKENIKKLEADFLHLEESEIFNLGNWEHISKKIERDFNPLLVDIEAID